MNKKNNQNINDYFIQKDENTVLDLLLLIFEFANGYYHKKDNSGISETSTLKVNNFFMHDNYILYY